MNLEEMKNKLEREAPNVDIKPYSHNIITLTLNMIKDNYGVEEANRAIREFDLDELGWSDEIE